MAKGMPIVDARCLTAGRAHNANQRGPSMVELVFGGVPDQPVLFVFHGSPCIGTPLLPAAHEYFDLRIPGQFQSERLDRGPSPGLSTGHGSLVRLNPALVEHCP